MKILIFGATGMIGHRVWLNAREKWGNDVYGVCRRQLAEFIDYNLYDENLITGVDVTDWTSTKEILKRIRPDVIINALGITIRKTEIGNIETALAVNSFFPRRLLKWAQENKSRVIHFSTDCVFDGSQGSYLETSQPTAKDNYGRTKFLGEIEGASALTLRFSCIGRELYAHSELLDWFLLQKGKKIKGYSGAMYSGVTTHVIARETCRMIEKFPELNGVYQVSSAEISKYDLLCMAKINFQLDVEIEKFENYISNKTLNCDKYKRETGFTPASWREMMNELSSDRRIAYKNF